MPLNSTSRPMNGFATLWPQKKAIRGANLIYLS